MIHAREDYNRFQDPENKIPAEPVMYFGTDLHSYGHYKWKISDDGTSLILQRDYDLPFRQQGLRKVREDGYYYMGDMTYIQGRNWTIISIYGSCVDHRGGTESTFFIKEKMSRDEFWSHLKTLPIVQKMIIQMPFRLQWLTQSKK